MDAKTRHEYARGKIIKVLAPEHPHPLDVKLLRRVLDDFGVTVSERDLESYIAYLEEREYVATDKTRSGINLITITAKGLDLIDGRIDDKGVEVDF